MKAIRREDFESEVDYIYSVVDVLKGFTQPQREALMLVALMHSKEELDAVEVFQRYRTTLHVYQTWCDAYEKAWPEIEGDLLCGKQEKQTKSNKQ